MKTTKFFLSALAILAAVSCAKDLNPAQSTNDQQVPKGFVAVSMDAEIDDLTKAASLGSDLSVTWEVGDSIAVFDGVNTDANKFRVSSVNGNVARIWGTVSESATLLTAVYPYTAATSFTSGKLTLSIPAAQKIETGKVIDGKALVSVARTLPGSNFSFKNVVSLAKFTVAAGTSSVALVGNASEAFVGSCTEGDEGLTAASTKLTVSAAEGTLAAGSYYAAICPATFTTGITVATTTTEGASVKKSANSAAFVKNGGINLGDISTGTKVPTEIATKEDLVAWATYRSYLPAGTTTKFTADIDMAGVDYQVPTDNFCGNVDGQNHRVYNITTTSEKTNDVGLLGRIGDGVTSYTVKNICAGSKDYDFTAKTGTYDGVSKFTFMTPAPIAATGNVSGTYYYPGLVTYLHKTSVMENVVNFVAIDITAACTCNRRIGGVAGTMKDGAKILNCTNYGTITDNGSVATGSGWAATTGGIVGGMDGANGTLSGDKNYGKITVNNAYNNSVAGITGISHKVGLLIENCENHGDIDIKTVSATSDNTFGGITSYFNTATVTIKGCKNYGSILCEPAEIATKNVYLGGVAGQVGYSAATCIINDCHNYGAVTLAPAGACNANTMVGGLVGYYGSNSGVLENCSNEAAVIKQGAGKNNYMGGLVGYVHGNAKKASFKNSENKGAVTTCSSDSNLGYLGGLFGFTTNESAAADAITVQGCNNSGAVTVAAPLKSYSYIGGVAGYFGTNTLATSCNNTALVTPCTENEDVAKCCRVGGIAGGVAGTLTECANSGDIYCNPGTAGLTLVQIGGVSSGAYNPQSVTKCSSTGKITVEGCSKSNAAGTYSYVGAVTGQATNSGKYTDCVAGGEIVVNAADSIAVGGLVGLVNANTGSAAVTMAEGCTVNVKITVASSTLPKSGMVAGFWKTGDKANHILGSTTSPIKVSGSLNGTTVTTDNLSTLVSGSGNAASDYHVVNAVLAQ